MMPNVLVSGAHGAVGAGAVFDHNWLAEALVELLPDGARQNVGAAARGIRRDNAQRS